MRWVVGHFAAIAAVAMWVSAGVAGPAATPEREAATAQLLALHQEVIDAHLAGNVAGILDRESEDYVVANRGEVTFPTLAERRQRLGPFLSRTRFDGYRDLVQPVVQVSPDGALGWVIAQIEATGVQENGDGTSEKIRYVSAWIELYERRDGRWYRVGNVSNFRPDAAAQ
ncbi:MAG TPA: hypothetical protein VFX92_08030 [Candidatus Krumholzibacteria bacterium]|nr:hypothetical protein [Candidatus Krumholzibacteria bacterium]